MYKNSLGGGMLHVDPREKGKTACLSHVQKISVLGMHSKCHPINKVI